MLPVPIRNCVVVFSSYRPLRDLHSFPTRRSSDLTAARRRQCGSDEAADRDRPRNGARACRRGDPRQAREEDQDPGLHHLDRKSTRLNSSHTVISYAVFCLKKKNSPSTLSRFTAPT